MTPVAVCDSSALVALLADSGPAGGWAAVRLTGCRLAAPSLVDFEVANVLRRQEMRGAIGHETAAQAHADLLRLTIERWPYSVVSARVWELRHHVSVYDASYVAVAEQLGAPLITLDSRLGRAHGLRCRVETP